MCKKRFFLSLVAVAALSVSAPSLGMKILNGIIDGIKPLAGPEICRAVRDRDFETVKELVEKWKVNCNKVYSRNNFSLIGYHDFDSLGFECDLTPLCVACIATFGEKVFGNFDKAYKIIEFLLKNGAKDSINRPIDDGRFYFTPFMFACQGGSLKIVKLLVKNGADVSKCYKPKHKRSFKFTPIFSACFEPINRKVVTNVHPEIVKFLLENGAAVDENAQSELFSFRDIGTKEDAARRYLDVAFLYDQCDKEEKMRFIEGFKTQEDVYDLLVKRSRAKGHYKSNFGVVNMLDNMKKQLGGGNYRKYQDCIIRTVS
jgi:Ankyrin repeat.